MRSKYPVYAVLIKLYPKRYRKQYGDQMLQTLADMLDDQVSQSGRTLVWLRVGAELPVNLVQQNLNAVGESAMNKLTAISNKRLIIGAGVSSVLLIIILGITLQNPIRNRLVPDTVGIFYRHGVNQMLMDQNRLLADPMAKLLGAIPRVQTNCYSVLTQNIHNELGCESNYTGRAQLIQSDTSKQSMLKRVADIETALKSQGYQHGNNGVTLTSLVTGTYQGEDYNPDAYYEKVIGQYDCVFDVAIAYANPAPAAIHIDLHCVRTFNFLGAPTHEVYRSQDGSPVYRS